MPRYLLNGTIGFAIGLFLMTLALGCAGLQILLPGGPLAFILLTALAFVGANLIALGLYRMIRHLYRTISRTEPGSDRPLRGTPLYLAGQFGSVMAVTVMLFFAALPTFANRFNERDAVWGVVPGWLATVGFGLAYFTGLLIMLTDLNIRFREIDRMRSARPPEPAVDDEDEAPPGPGRPRPGVFPEGIEPAHPRRPRPEPEER
jgi:hypothetical protein